MPFALAIWSAVNPQLKPIRNRFSPPATVWVPEHEPLEAGEASTEELKFTGVLAPPGIFNCCPGKTKSGFRPGFAAMSAATATPHLEAIR